MFELTAEQKRAWRYTQSNHLRAYVLSVALETQLARALKAEHERDCMIPGYEGCPNCKRMDSDWLAEARRVLESE